MTVPEARAALRALADAQLSEERPRPPAWAPFTGLHRAREVLAADAARRTRAEHLRRLADAPDPLLHRMLAAGWRPGSSATAPILTTTGTR